VRRIFPSQNLSILGGFSHTPSKVTPHRNRRIPHKEVSHTFYPLYYCLGFVSPLSPQRIFHNYGDVFVQCAITSENELSLVIFGNQNTTTKGTCEAKMRKGNDENGQKGEEIQEEMEVVHCMDLIHRFLQLTHVT
jgi:hypothetical protein